MDRLIEGIKAKGSGAVVDFGDIGQVRYPVNPCTQHALQLSQDIWTSKPHTLAGCPEIIIVIHPLKAARRSNHMRTP